MCVICAELEERKVFSSFHLNHVIFINWNGTHISPNVSHTWIRILWLLLLKTSTNAIFCQTLIMKLGCAMIQKFVSGYSSHCKSSNILNCIFIYLFFGIVLHFLLSLRLFTICRHASDLWFYVLFCCSFFFLLFSVLFISWDGVLLQRDWEECGACSFTFCYCIYVKI